MTIFAELTVPAGTFRPGPLLPDGTDVRAELERRVPGGSSVEYVWLVGADRDPVVEGLAARPGVTDLRVVDELPERTLVRLSWEGGDRVWGAIEETDAVLLGAEGDAESWTLRLRVPDRAGLRRFYERATAEGGAVTLQQVNGFDAPGRGDRFDLSSTQREAVVAAFERGYFEIPRRTTLEGVADELGVSDQAVSERLRRGLETLLEEALAADGPTDGPGTASPADRPPDRDDGASGRPGSSGGDPEPAGDDAPDGADDEIGGG